MVGGDTETPRLSALLLTGAPLLHGSPALNTLLTAAGTVRPGEIEPTLAPSVRLGELAVEVLLSRGGGELV